MLAHLVVSLPQIHDSRSSRLPTGMNDCFENACHSERSEESRSGPETMQDSSLRSPENHSPASGPHMAAGAGVLGLTLTAYPH
jgi:hypothetical protein